MSVCQKFSIAAAIAGGLAFAACDAPPPAVAAKTAPAIYAARGVVQEVRAASGKVVVAHETIAGYMAAMTMEFTASDPRELTTLQRGDVVSFRLSVTAESSAIDQLRKVGTTPLPPLQLSPAAPVPDLMLPDCALVDSSGHAFHLFDLKGRALAVTFIFTRCPLPDFCPRLNAHFAAAQRTLGATSTAQFLSISLDPDYDTPARLAAYAAAYQPDPARWIFATGERGDIEKLGAVFGLQIARTGVLPEHDLRTIVVDPAGHVRRIFSGNEWSAGQLVAELQLASQSTP